MRAACNGVTEIIKALLAGGAEVDARNQYGNTALIEATNCAFGDEALKLLLDAGTKVDARNTEGRTALFDAAAKGSDKAVQTLIDAGADANADCLQYHCEKLVACADYAGRCIMDCLQVYTKK